MPKEHVRDRSHSKKAVKLDTTTRNTYRYSDGADVLRRLQTQEQADLIDGEKFALFTEVNALNPQFFRVALTALRNQLTVKSGEEPVQPQDERLALARSWLEISPGAQSVFSIWENTTEVWAVSHVLVPPS